MTGTVRPLRGDVEAVSEKMGIVGKEHGEQNVQRPWGDVPLV